VLKVLGTAKVWNSRRTQLSKAINAASEFTSVIGCKGLRTCMAAAATTTVEIEQAPQRAGVTMGGEHQHSDFAEL
jgi:hypothetical protein